MKIIKANTYKNHANSMTVNVLQEAIPPTSLFLV